MEVLLIKLEYRIMKLVIILNGFWYRVKKTLRKVLDIHIKGIKFLILCVQITSMRSKYGIDKEAMKEIKEKYENREINNDKDV